MEIIHFVCIYYQSTETEEIAHSVQQRKPWQLYLNINTRNPIDIV